MQINMVSSGEDLLSDQLQRGPIPDRENHSLHQTHVSETHAFHSDQEVRTPVLSGKELMLRDSGHSLRSNEQRSISSITTDRASEIVHALQTDQEVITPTMREKVSEDGYNWRKYGQKLVRGNEFVRSYYKCTHPRCQAKKQLDCTHEGQIVETICFGDHFHAKVPNLPRAVGMVVSVVEEKLDNSSSTIAKDKSSGRHGQTPRQNEPTENPRLAVTAASDNVQASPLQSNRVKDDVDNDDKLGSKRRKKENSNTNVPLVERTIGDHRVVQTLSEVDFVDDGYRWRKYGQKLVKGNPNPRNYYRCSNSGCPAKKHVERASHDPKLVITSYEGQHDHDMPPSRTVTPNVAGKSPKEAQYRESAAKVEHEAGCPGTNVHAGSDQLSKSTEGKNDDPKNESEATAVVRLDKAKQSIFYPESRAHEPQNGKSGTVEGSDIAHHSMCHKDETKNLRNCESEIKSEHDGTASHVKVIHATSCPETSFGEQEQTPKTPKTEAAQS